MKAGFKILFASVALLFYFFAIVYPFFLKSAFVNGGFVWKSPSSRIYYALAFYPALWGYLYVVLGNILKVKSIRFPVYAFCFAVIFLAAHAAAIIFGLGVLLYMLLTVPAGALGLLLVLMWAAKQDFKDRFSGGKDDEADDAGKSLFFKGVCFIILPCFLIGMLVTAVAEGGKKAETAVAKEKISPLLIKDSCSHFSELIEKANSAVKIKEKDSLEEIVTAYRNEFQNEDVYGKVELHQSEQESGEFYLYNGKVVWLIFTLEKKGDCVAGSQNCFFSLMYGKEPCTQYITAQDQRPASSEAKDLTASANSSK